MQPDLGFGSLIRFKSKVTKKIGLHATPYVFSLIINAASHLSDYLYYLLADNI